MATNHNGYSNPGARHVTQREAGKWLLTGLGILWVLRRILHLRNVTANQPAPSEPIQTRFSVEQPRRAHEHTDANPKWIFGCVVGLGVLVLAVHFILAGWLSSLNSSRAPSDSWRPIQPPAPVQTPFPKLQIAPPLELDNFRAREETELNSYGWINKTAGVVRVPIERAIDLVLKEGLPTRNATNQARSGPSSYQLIQERTEHRQPEIQGEK